MELQQYVSGCRLSVLRGLSVIEVKGEDSNAFLNNLLTNRIVSDESVLTLAGWANAKGRLLAMFRILKGFAPDSYLLVLPSDLAASAAKKLSIYVFRAKVTVTDISGQCRAACLFGDGADEALSPAGIACPAEVGKVTRNSSLIAARLPAIPAESPAGAPGLQRLLLVGSPEALRALPAASLDSEDAWPLSECAAGFPCVTAATAGLFVPQAIGLDLIGGVAFDKGCYPGQEVIGRLHMRDAKHNVLCWGVSAGEPMPEGADVVSDGMAVGRIVRSVRADGKVLSLASVPAGLDCAIAGGNPVSLTRIPA